MATVKKLTHQTIKGLTTDKEYEKFFEEEWQKGSFGVRVSGKTGRKSFVLRYRNDSGKQRKMTLGKFDETGSSGLSFSQAWEKAYEIIGKVVAGEDPAESNENNGPETIKDLVDQFIKVHGKNISETTKDDYKSRLERDLIPEYGNLSPDELTRGKIAQIMDHIAVDRDSNISANRFRSVTHKLYNFAVGRGIVDSNPVSDVPTKKEDSSRDRHLSDEEIKTLWGVLEYKDPVIESFYKILLLCGQRSGETKESKWEHIEGKVWTVPSENAKNSRENQILVASQKSVSSDGSKYT